jgi:hypothetical protein
MVKKNRCKYCNHELTFDYNIENGIRDIDSNGKAHSLIGIWREDILGICNKFHSNDKQWELRTGFFYCDEQRAEKCSQFCLEEKNDNK